MFGCEEGQSTIVQMRAAQIGWLAWIQTAEEEERRRGGTCDATDGADCASSEAGGGALGGAAVCVSVCGAW